MLVLLLGAGGGAAYLLRHDDAGVPQRLAAVPCPSARATPTAARPRPSARPLVLPQPRQVRVTVLNGTARSLLAKVVGDQLAARGFVVSGMGNAPKAVAGPSVVSFGPGAQAAGTLVARSVLGARLVPARSPAGAVTLVLGSEFRRLATPAEVVAAGRVAPRPSPSATASPAAACGR